MVKDMERGESTRHMNPVAEEAMSIARSSDDSAAAARGSVPTSWYAIFTKLKNKQFLIC